MISVDIEKKLKAYKGQQVLKISAQFETIKLRHPEIQQNCVRPVLEGEGQSLIGFSGFENSVCAGKSSAE